RNSVHLDAYVNGWIDWNQDGLFDDASEKVISNEVLLLSTQDQLLSRQITVPTDAACDETIMRVRIASEAIGPAEAAPQMVDAAPSLPLVAPEPRSAADIRQLHAAILDRLGPSPVAEDQLIRDMGGRTGDVGAGIVELETLGHIRRQPGGLLALSEPR
ncbi:MAG: GEVED domain-containing protein, partial [Pseudomonadota bacterium]